MNNYEREGYEAAEHRESFRDNCPYTFDKAGDAFDRAKMDAWFYGWKRWLDEHGLQFDFKPHATREPASNGGGNG